MSESPPEAANKAPEVQKYVPKEASTFRQHSNLALLIYNQSASKDARQLKFSRFERRFARIWTSPVVPISLFFGHLYLIALFLRNPFQKVDLD